MEKPEKYMMISSNARDANGNYNTKEYYNADDMDTYLVQKDKEISGLVEVLESANDLLNALGCVHLKTRLALNKHKTINE